MFEGEKTWIEELNPELRFQNSQRKTYTIKTTGIIGVSFKGELIGIKQPKDPPVIIIVGQRQSGKSLLAARLAGIIHHTWKSSVCYLNDIYGHMSDHSKEQGQKEFCSKLYQIKDYPKSLPIVVCYPDSSTLKTLDVSDYSLKVSINWRELVENIYHFSLTEKGKRMLPEASFQFFEKRVKDGLKMCTNVREVYNFLNSFDPKQDPDVDKSIIKAIKRVFYYIIEEKISDMQDEESVKYSYSQLEYNKQRYDIMSALIQANLIPVVVTRHIPESYLQGIIGYWVDKLFDEKRVGCLRGPQPLYFIIDEINTLDKIEDKVISKIPAQGGNINIGGVFIGQNYSKISVKIKQNSAYTIIFKQTGTEVKALREELGLSERFCRIAKLLNTYQCIFTTTESFEIYDPMTGIIREDPGPIPGFAIPSTSMHRLEKGGTDHPYNLIRKYKVIYRWDLSHPMFQKPINSEDYKIKKKYIRPYVTIEEKQDLRKMFYKGSKIRENQTISYDELMQFGYKVVIIQLRYQDGSTAKFYTIMPVKNESYPDVTKVPMGHSLVYNLVTDMISLNGEKAFNIKTNAHGTSGWYKRLE